MKDALEHVYQKALHRGLVDIRVDGERVGMFCRPEDLPFRETATSRISDGTEMTLDHVGVEGLFIAQRGSEFSEMREDTFENFLTKADQSYYERDMPNAKRRDDMRWSHYSARDHEPGRPYVVIGPEFFARLVRGIVQLRVEPGNQSAACASAGEDPRRGNRRTRADRARRWADVHGVLFVFARSPQ